MKKASAISLIALFLFNLCGYMFVFQYMQYKGDARLEASLDKDIYNDAELMEVKVPMNVAYQTTRSDYERYDGEVEIDGTPYKYVKRKVVNDTLYLLCIPNRNKMHLESAKNDLFLMTSGIMQTDQSGNTDNNTLISLRILQSPYDDYITSFDISAPIFNVLGYSAYGSEPGLFSFPHQSPKQPPEGV